MTQRTVLAATILLAFLPVARPVPGAEPDSTTPLPAPAAAGRDGSHDFDFLFGRWSIHNRRLIGRLRGSHEWAEFEATSEVRPILDGLGNVDEFRTEYWPGFVGFTLRIYDPATRRWSLFWVDNRTGVLQPPVIGAFDGDEGVFEGDDTFEGRPIRVRFLWRRGTDRAHWEQAFSADGGETWETNWVMELTREAAGPARQKTPRGSNDVEDHDP